MTPSCLSLTDFNDLKCQRIRRLSVGFYKIRRVTSNKFG